MIAALMLLLIAALYSWWGFDCGVRWAIKEFDKRLHQDMDAK